MFVLILEKIKLVFCVPLLIKNPCAILARELEMPFSCEILVALWARKMLFIKLL